MRSPGTATVLQVLVQLRLVLVAVAAAGQCKQCASDWAQVQFVGVGPQNQSDLCDLVHTCASDVADCDFTQPPDQVFPTCKNLKANPLAPKPTLRQFTGSVTGRNSSTLFINQTTGKPGPFVLFMAPQFSNDYWDWACYYLFSYLATQGIATFTAEIPDPADASRDNWNHVPSSAGGGGGQPYPYPYECAQLDAEGPGCDNSTFGSSPPFLHDMHLEDIIGHAESLGYSPNASVWWGYSEGAAMVSEHLNYLLYHQQQQNSSSAAAAAASDRPHHLPKGMVLESNGGSYCYAFRPQQEDQLKATPFWSGCNSWFNNNCCPNGLTEQWYWEHSGDYPSHPPVLLVGGDSDATADPNGLKFYHDTMRGHGGHSATATWSGTQHGITPLAFGFAASFIKDALQLGNGTAAAGTRLKTDDSDDGFKLVKFSGKKSVCLDGTPGGFLWRQGTQPSSVVVHMEGGGWCYNEADCMARSKTDIGSSKGWKSVGDMCRRWTVVRTDCCRLRRLHLSLGHLLVSTRVGTRCGVACPERQVGPASVV